MIILTFGFCRVNKDGHDHSRFFSFCSCSPPFCPKSGSSRVQSIIQCGFSAACKQSINNGTSS